MEGQRQLDAFPRSRTHRQDLMTLMLALREEESKVLMQHFLSFF